MPHKSVHIESREAIGARITALRLAMGYVRAIDFARYVGMTEQALNNYESGRRRPSLDEALKLCAATGVPLDWIYRGTNYFLPRELADKIGLLPPHTPSPSTPSSKKPKKRA